MNVRNLFTDDDAVSPVIGVILMVAITVILAAVIGAFVLNIGGSQESAPQVTWEWSDSSGGPVELTHGGGDRIDNPGQVTIEEDGSSGYNTTLSGVEKAGDSIEITQTNLDDDSGTLTVVWESSSGSDSQILSEHEFDIT